MNQAFANTIQQHCPTALTVALTRAKRVLFPTPAYRRIAAIYQKMGRPTRVLQGPFAGMAYVELAMNSAFLPMLLGTYEWDLHAVTQRMIALAPDLIIDVGCAEGYYAVGLVRRLPKARVIAYDTLKLARDLVGKLARLNGVRGQMDIGSFCSPETLEKALATATRPLVVCDCEGFEEALLRPEEVPQLRRASILVELHDRIVPGISELLRERFAATHDIERIDETPRTPDQLPPVVELATDEAHEALLEPRGYLMHWFYMTPK